MASRENKKSSSRSRKKTGSVNKNHKTQLDSTGNGDTVNSYTVDDLDNKNLKDLSLDELRDYLAARESREGGNVSGRFTSSNAIVKARHLSRWNTDKEIDPMSVCETLRDRTIMIVGGTGFLGRIMLYMVLKHVPDIKRIYLLVRPTHGSSGEARVQREILKSPVFTETAGDAQYFKDVFDNKVMVVEGDASRENLGIDSDTLKLLREEVEVVLNTAGNVEFNPPLDMSINANTLATREVLKFAETTRFKRYVHVSTCYVADRVKHPDIAPEEIVSEELITARGNHIRLDVEHEIEGALESVAEIKRYFESSQKTKEFMSQAETELERMGRADAPRRLVEKTARSLRTMAMREELIREGRDRAQRINRPNVYTYTKTLAELLVKSHSERVNCTIVRPSIVETSLRTPFPGWNEGIQGSAPLVYLVHRGHRMIPSLSQNPNQHPDAILDIIPVDEVAAGTVLAMCALLNNEHELVYQLSAGPIDPPITPARLLNVYQTYSRRMEDGDHVRPSAWWTRTLQAYPVTRKTWERFSSPRMFALLSRARSRLERMNTDRVPPVGEGMIQRVRLSVEKFYQISLTKNKIFQEFLPFMNEGYPVFQNHNTVNLWRRLPEEEKQHFHFNPYDVDYLRYLNDLHMDALFRWIFPVLEKRFRAIDKIAEAQSQSKGNDRINDMQLSSALRAVFDSDLEFRDRMYILRRAAGRRIASRRRPTPDANFQLDQEFTPSADEPEYWATLESELSSLAGGRSIINFQEESVRDLQRFCDHIEFITGVPVTPELLIEKKSPARLRRYLEKWRIELNRMHGKSRSRLSMRLPEEGVNLPEWMSRPTSEFLYRLQMWFYRSVLNVQIRGKDNIPLNNNNVIVVANHSSHLDYGLVWFSLGDYARDMGILAARDYFFDRFTKSTFFSNFLNLIPIERTENRSYAKSLQHALDFLNQGGPLLIFPEGTRSPDGELRPFRHGLGYLVWKTGADVLPMRLYDTHKTLPKGKTIIRGTGVRVDIGKVISFEQIEKDNQGLSPTRTYANISRQLYEAVRDIRV